MSNHAVVPCTHRGPVVGIDGGRVQAGLQEGDDGLPRSGEPDWELVDHRVGDRAAAHTHRVGTQGCGRISWDVPGKLEVWSPNTVRGWPLAVW